MKKGISRLLVGATLLSGAMFGQPAHATDGAVCVVSGSVQLVKRTFTIVNGVPQYVPAPLNNTIRNAAYLFVDTNIQCNGTISATYKVTAQGTTTGLANPQGEDCSGGKNDVAGGTNGFFNNKLSGTKQSGTGPSSITGDVNFTRVGGIVHVSGTLVSGSASYPYVADLNFTPAGTPPRVNDLPNPDANALAGCEGALSQGITQAALDGTAVIYAA